jgi:hypothetical protein
VSERASERERERVRARAQRWGTKSEDRVSCSHACLPKSVPSENGEKRAEELLEEFFKTRLALEDFYSCVGDEGSWRLLTR